MTEVGDRALLIVWFVVGILTLAMVFIASLTLGAVSISASDVAGWITGSLPADALASEVLSAVRLPRALGGLIVGAGLGAAGVSLQRVLRTPVIDAHIVGVTAASGIGVALGYAFGPTSAKGAAAVIVGAVAGILYGVISAPVRRSVNQPIMLVLFGLAAGLTMTAWTGLFVLAIDSPAVPTISFFVFGSLSGSTMATVAVAGPIVMAGLAVLWWIGPGLDLLSLGDRASTDVGLDVGRQVRTALAAVGLAVGGCVALGGSIGFIGLLVPLALRPLFGPTQRLLIPAAAVGGAVVVLIFDIAARTLAAPMEIPIGLLTAAFGGPALFVLMRRAMPR